MSYDSGEKKLSKTGSVDRLKELQLGEKVMINQ